jgi:superoxide dismutase, Cu-Zn family
MDGTPEEPPLAKPDRDAEAEFKAAKGQKISGEAELKEVPNGVQVSVEVKDAPTGMKAIHIHDKGDCSNMEAKSMGEPLAPKREMHGLPGPAEHHLGDLGNITIASDGTGRLETVVPGANLKGNDAMSFRGKAMQLDGAAGKPLACAVIEG